MKTDNNDLTKLDFSDLLLTLNNMVDGYEKEILRKKFNLDNCETLLNNDEVYNKNRSKNKLLTYTISNKWQSIPKEKTEASRRHRIHGVEIRKLEKDHILCGEYGLFATQKFFKFDVVGEYTG